jgi:hypothetical protein
MAEDNPPIAQTPFLIRDCYPDELLPNQGIMFEGINKEGQKAVSVIICCPQCGVATGSKQGHFHTYDPVTNSITPSVNHSCGFHKTLKNGYWQ